MKEIGFLFTTSMVTAILEGRKTMTRRMAGLKKVNESPDAWIFNGVEVTDDTGPQMAIFESDSLDDIIEVKPRAVPGDLIYARETWCHSADVEGEFYYKATNPEVEYEDGDGSPWKSPLHMPKEAARIWLECTEVRVERLQDITEDDAIAEGIEPDPTGFQSDGVMEWMNYKNYMFKEGGYRYISSIDSFHSLIDSINGPRTWSSNPWVLVYEFKVLSTTGRP